MWKYYRSNRSVLLFILLVLSYFALQSAIVHTIVVYEPDFFYSNDTMLKLYGFLADWPVFFTFYLTIIGNLEMNRLVLPLTPSLTSTIITKLQILVSIMSIAFGGGIYISVKMKNYAESKATDERCKQQFHHVLVLMMCYTILDSVCFAVVIYGSTISQLDDPIHFRDLFFGISAYLHSPMICIYSKLFDQIKGIKFTKQNSIRMV
ncbi:hypothetical protein BC833DRAFT_565813 [Globomyces pollinis-pini]|nr:hypothetical protein BC833DRAFT_565813 [Globomyces pollinis-pini]